MFKDTDNDLFVFDEFEFNSINKTPDLVTDLFLILDSSKSMEGTRIEQLNFMASELLNEFIDLSKSRNVDLNVRVIEFNDEVNFIMGTVNKGVPVEEALANFKDITDTHGASRIDLALKLVNELIQNNQYNYHYRKTPPIVILISDGQSNYKKDTIAQSNLLKSIRVSRFSDNNHPIFITIGVIDANMKELKEMASDIAYLYNLGGKDYSDSFSFEVRDSNKISRILESVIFQPFIIS